LAWLLAQRRHLPPPAPRPPTESLRVIASLHTGWSAALQIPVVRGVFFVTIIMNVMIFPYQQLIAIVAGDILSVGPFWMGVLAGADGIGAAVTSSRLAFGPAASRPGLLFGAGSVAAAGFLVALALSPVFVLSLLVQLILGVCAGLFGAHQSALVLNATPEAARARALGLIATAIGMTPIGMLLIGGTSSTLGAQVAIAMMGSLGFVGLLLVVILNPQLRAAKIT
jgi:MFS family permease